METALNLDVSKLSVALGTVYATEIYYRICGANMESPATAPANECGTRGNICVTFY